MKASLVHIRDSISALWSIAARLTGILIVVTVVALIIVQLAKDVVVVDAIDVPESLEATGYKPRVVSRRLISEVYQILNTSYSGQDLRRQFQTADQSKNLDLLVPSSSISITTLVSSVRAQFNSVPKRIGGEIIAHGDSLCLYLQIQRGAISEGVDSYTFCGPTGSLATIIQSGALFIVSHLEPLKAAGYLLDKKPDSCLAILRQCLKTRQEDAARIHDIWALLLITQAKYDSAVVHLQQSIHESPRQAMYYNNLAAVLSYQDKFEEALRQARIAVRLNPTDPIIHAQIGSILIDQRKYVDAEVELRRAIALDSTNSAILYYLGELYLQIGDTAKAIQNLLESVSNDPMLPFAPYSLALIYDASDSLARSSEYYQLGIAADPSFVTAYLNLANVLLRQQQYREALSWLNKVPDDCQVHPRIWKDNIISQLTGDSPDKLKAKIHFLRGIISDSLKLYEQARVEYRDAYVLDSAGATGRAAKRAVGRLRDR